MRDRRLLIVLGAAALAVVLFLVLRPGDDDESAQPPPPPPATTTDTTATGTDSTPPPPPATTAEPPPPPPAVRSNRIEIAIRGGKPVGGVRRVTVDQDSRVVLVVRSNVADEVHVHGYDLMRDVAPGKPVRIAFRATLPGKFEVELEGRGLQIADVTVEP